MKKIIIYTKFVASIIAIIVAYNVYMEFGRTVMDQGNDSMKPAVRPRQWVWYSKVQRNASQLRKNDIIVYRDPKNPEETRIARVKALPGEIASNRTLPRGYVWVLLDDKKQKPDSRTFGPLHEHFIRGKAIWLKGRLPMID